MTETDKDQSAKADNRDLENIATPIDNIASDNIALNQDMACESLTQLDSAYIMVMRLSAFIWSVLLAIPIFIGDIILAEEGLIEPFIIAAPIAMLFLILIYVLPRRRFMRWGYLMGIGEIQIVRGYLFYTDTIVPFSRVQHIDVGQGPVERLFGISSLILHTAGTHNSTVVLPGLRRAIAEQMRDDIRATIKADMI